MKSKLLKLLALCSALILVTGLLPAGALAEDKTEAHVIVAEWEDENDGEEIRPDSLKVSLDGEEVTLKASTGWAGTADGKPDAEWKVTAPKGYTVTTTDKDGITVATLTHKVERTTINVSAVWVDKDDANGVRPKQVSVQLLADGVPYGFPVTLTGSGWTGSWTNVPVNRKGSAITYTLKAVEKPELYTVEIGTDTITYTLKTGTLTIEEIIRGVEEDAQARSLRLQVDGPDARMPMTLTYRQFKGGSYTISDVLPGAYLVKTLNAETLYTDHYLDPANSTIIDANYVHAGKEGKLKLKTTWVSEIPDREENPDPTSNYGSLVFEIYGPDETMPITITYADFVAGRYTLDNLKPGTYAIVERNAGTLVDYYTLQTDSVTGVTFNVTGDGSVTASLYNHYAPSITPPPQEDVIDIPVQKIWDDNDDAAGNRPVTITVRLFADGVEIDSRKLTAANNWSTVFEELPVYREKDVEIVYSILEDPVPNYLTSMDGTTITNTYTAGLTSAAVRKIWDDNNNFNAIRPNSIIMTLHNGDTTVTTVTLNEANGWYAVVENLPTEVNGKPAIYTWTEQTIPGYTLTSMTVEGTVAIFTNSLFVPPQDEEIPPNPGVPIYVFEEYETPLGVAVEINHVGDCFD